MHDKLARELGCVFVIIFKEESITSLWCKERRAGSVVLLYQNRT